MKSGKQRRAEIKTKKEQREAKKQSLATARPLTTRPLGIMPVNESLLAPYKSYGAPGYVMRDYH